MPLTPELVEDRENAAKSVDFSAFGEHLRPVIEESLKECGKENSRKGTFLTPLFTVYLVFSLCIRRDLNQNKVINWMIKAFRWAFCVLPSKTVSEGAVSHARMRLGANIFRMVFHKTAGKDGGSELPPDFHGRSTVIFDGTTASMPDTPENRDTFGRPSLKKNKPVSSNESCPEDTVSESDKNPDVSGGHPSIPDEGTGFPQIRIVALLSLSLRKVFDIAYASYTGKGTGERALMSRILAGFTSDAKILCLLDAGLYAFDLFKDFNKYSHEFIIKVPANIKLKPVKGFKYSDGSYRAVIKKNSSEITVRVIPYQIRGFRASRLITNIFDENITAMELAIHYHQRWDIEITFDEIKTHQCAVLKGHAATVLRSKIPELVIQELFAMLIVYNSVRNTMCLAAEVHNKDPRMLSFLDTLQFTIECFEAVNKNTMTHKLKIINYFIYLVSDSEIDRPRRGRVNPRVIKVKSSKFTRKNDTHKSQIRNFEKDLIISLETA